MIYENTPPRLCDFTLDDARFPVLLTEHGSKITFVTGKCLIQYPYRKGEGFFEQDFPNLDLWLLDDLGETDEDFDENPLAGVTGSWLALEYEQLNAGTPTAHVCGEYILYMLKSFSTKENPLTTERIILGLIGLQREDLERFGRWVQRANHVLLG